MQVEGMRGDLRGGALGFERLRWQGAGGARLEIDAFELPQLRWVLRPPGGWLALELQAPRIGRLAWVSGPASDTAPAPAPASLRLPLQLRVQALRIDTLQLDALPPVRELRLSAALGAQGGRVHRLQSLSLQWRQLQLQASGQLSADAPLAL